MDNPTGQAITSLEALVSTIRTDFQSYCWFAYLIRQETLRERLCGEEDIRRSYRRLEAVTVGQGILIAALFLLFGAVLLSRAYAPVGISLILLAAGAALHVTKRKTVARICSSLFAQDFDGRQFAKETLYQITERYADEHKILSLVDAITLTDRAVWGVFLLAVFVTYFIYPLGIGTILLCVIAAVYGVRAAVNTPYVYDHIK